MIDRKASSFVEVSSNAASSRFGYCKNLSSDPSRAASQDLTSPLVANLNTRNAAATALASSPLVALRANARLTSGRPIALAYNLRCLSPAAQATQVCGCVALTWATDVEWAFNTEASNLDRASEGSVPQSFSTASKSFRLRNASSLAQSRTSSAPDGASDTTIAVEDDALYCCKYDVGTLSLRPRASFFGIRTSITSMVHSCDARDATTLRSGASPSG
mmetsp:Transcript_12341/g.32491  ORF Transcript_12341/g.32491 Transcript_12341/m.32491 type:complete len:218 (+) Transcript_12341:2056-2709(+)